MSKLANTFLGIANFWGSLKGAKMHVMVDDHTVSISFRNNLDETNYQDSTKYNNAWIHHKDISSPVEIDPDELDEGVEITVLNDLFPMLRYEFRKALEYEHGESDLLIKISVAILAVIIITQIMVLAVVALS